MDKLVVSRRELLQLSEPVDDDVERRLRAGRCNDDEAVPIRRHREFAKSYLEQ